VVVKNSEHRVRSIIIITVIPILGEKVINWTQDFCVEKSAEIAANIGVLARSSAKFYAKR